MGYSAACIGAGGGILYLLKKIGRQFIPLSPGTELATSFILGQGVLASIWLLLALKGWFTARLIAVITLLVAMIGFYLIRHLLIGIWFQMLDILRDLRAEKWIWKLLAAVAIFLCLLWGTSLGRTMAGDAGAYYMAIAKVVAHAHELMMLPGYENFSAVGMQGEMHHAALIALHSIDAAQLFAWPTSIAAAIMLLALGHQVGIERRGQWILLIMMYTTPTVIYMSGSGKVGVYAMAFGIAAYYWIIQFRRNASLISLWLTGLLMGFAIIAKMSYLLSMGVSILILFVWGFLTNNSKTTAFTQNLRGFLLSGFHIALAVIVALIPHLIKNYYLLDNPFAPFGSESQSWTNQVWFTPATTKRILLFYPLSMTFGTYWAPGNRLSPLVLAYLPLALLMKKNSPWFRNPITILTIAAIGGTIGWLSFRPTIIYPRYIMATLMLFALIPAKAVEYVSLREYRPRWLTTSFQVSVFVFVYAIISVFLGDVFFPIKTFKYLSGELENCERDYQYCGQLTMLNRNTEFGDRIMLGTYQRYWLRSDLLQCLSTTEDVGEIYSAPIEDRWGKLYQRGFKYLVADNITHQYLLDGLDFENTPNWLEVVEMSYDGQIVLYRLEYTDPPDIQQASCQRRGTSKVWQVISP